jgi:hypothetical protein
MYYFVMHSEPCDTRHVQGLLVSGKLRPTGLSAAKEFADWPGYQALSMDYWRQRPYS